MLRFIPLRTCVIVVLACTWLACVCALTPNNGVVADGTINAGEYDADEMCDSTNATVKWAITWNSTNIQLALSGPLLHKDNADLVVVYIDTDPQPNPTTGTGSTTGPTFNTTFTHTLPFTANYVYRADGNIRNGYQTFESGVWSAASSAGFHWGTGYTSVELTIPISQLTSPQIPTRIHLCAAYFMVENSTVAHLNYITPALNNNEGTTTLTFGSYWGFSLIDGVSPSATYHQNSYPTYSIATGLLSAASTWAGGISPAGLGRVSTAYVQNNAVVTIDTDTTLSNLIVLSGQVTTSARTTATFSSGSLVKNGDRCCGSLTSLVFENSTELIAVTGATTTVGTVTVNGALDLTGSVTVTNLTMNGNAAKINPQNSSSYFVYGTGGFLTYNAVTSSFVVGIEWRSVRNLELRGNSVLNLAAGGQAATSRSVSNGVLINQGCTLTMNATAMTGSLSISGALNLQGTMILSPNLASVVTSGNVVAAATGRLWRNGQSFKCPAVSVTATNASCTNNDGTLTTTVTSAVFTPITYYWSPGGSTQQNRNNLAPGNYTLTWGETNAYGCPGTTLAPKEVSRVCSTTGIATTAQATTAVVTTAAVTTAAVTTAAQTTSLVTTGTLTTLTTNAGTTTANPTPNTQTNDSNNSNGVSTTGNTGGDNIRGEKSGGGGSNVGVIVGVVVGLGVLLLLIVAALLVRRRRQQKQRREKREHMTDTDLSLTDLRTASFSSVKDVAAHSDQNASHRRTMEDEHLIIDKFGGNPKQGYFAIYDGHGGRDVVEYVAQNLHVNILNEMQKGSDVKTALVNGFLETDKEIVDKKIAKSGSTAVVAVVSVNSEGQKVLDVANIGDATAVLCRDGQALQLTFEHKASDAKEVERVTKDKGMWVLGGKVAGVLAVSRAFGDIELKQWVIADPHHQSVTLGPNDTHLILACDGLWDVCTPQDAVDLIKKETEKDALSLSQMLVSHALTHRSTDNVSVIVVEL